MKNLHIIYIDNRGINTAFMNRIHENIALLATHYWRISPTSWVVSSVMSAKEWTDKLKVEPPSDITYASLYEGYTGHTFIIKLDPSDRFGFMAQGFWDWFDKIGGTPILHVKAKATPEAEVKQ